MLLSRRPSVVARLLGPAATVGVIAIVGMALVWRAPTAAAYEAGAANSWTVSGNVASQTSASGLTTTVTMTGASRVISSTPIAVGLPPADYAPAIASPPIPLVNIGVGLTAGGSCTGTDGSHCSGLGQMIVSFSRPVRNPVLHFAGIGGGKIQGSNVSRYTAQFDLVGPTGSLGAPSPGATNLAVVGKALRSDPHGSSSCITTSDLGAGRPVATDLAGCGSVPVIGTFSTIAFDLSENWAIVQGVGNNTFQSDSLNLGVTTDQDFGDAPASYDGAQAPAHVVGDLSLGASVDADNTTVRDAAVSPFPESGTAVDSSGDDAAGADEDALAVPPTLLAGHRFDLTVPIAGASAVGEVCGFVDFDLDGTFDTGVERACAGFVAGQSSVVLTWAVPAAAVPAPTYLRLRAAYGGTGGSASTPTGRADSGEVEDHSATVVAPGSLAGTVFVDGTRAPVPGVTLTLLDAANVPVATTVTAADGSYSFVDLVPGSYRVVESQPAGFSAGIVAPTNEIAVSIGSGERVVAQDFTERPVVVPPVKPPETTSTTLAPTPTVALAPSTPVGAPGTPTTSASSRPVAMPATTNVPRRLIVPAADVLSLRTGPTLLASTGSDSGSLLALGVVALLTGVAVLVRRRTVRDGS